MRITSLRFAQICKEVELQTSLEVLCHGRKVQRDELSNNDVKRRGERESYVVVANQFSNYFGGMLGCIVVDALGVLQVAGFYCAQSLSLNRGA